MMPTALVVKRRCVLGNAQYTPGQLVDESVIDYIDERHLHSLVNSGYIEPVTPDECFDEHSSYIALKNMTLHGEVVEGGQTIDSALLSQSPPHVFKSLISSRYIKRVMPEEDPDGKVCMACQKALSKKAFSHDKRTKDGLKRYCNACVTH